MFPNLGGVSHQVGKLVPSLLSLGETLASWTEDACTMRGMCATDSITERRPCIAIARGDNDRMRSIGLRGVSAAAAFR